METGPAIDACHFAPIVALDGDEPGRGPLYAVEVSLSRDAQARLDCAIEALINAGNAINAGQKNHVGRARGTGSGQRPLAVMVSMSLEELAGRELEAATAALARAGIPSDLLMLRVPQYASGAQAALLERVAATGVTVVVSSLVVRDGEFAGLAGAPVDMIELPPALVDDIDRSRDSAAHVEEWLQFAHNIDWLVLARNVSRPSQAQILRRLGCDLAAGPLIGAPVEPAPSAGPPEPPEPPEPVESPQPRDPRGRGGVPTARIAG